ncbi:hypothetical protein LOC67_24625 [Stieleria sp. JC731]|uniref:hypothetical protein n=1 Tax=Pirellulaceae TaxID=2691357 RepID=UPI001E65C2F2|nr:hypothetical protein [Stieleria sp. JC731]MCC9603748.1 hypothetical protein [Stieleria sp. JC731]
MKQFFVNAESERPDFRLVVTYLWHDLYNVDTDGNSCNPASRTWTQLFIRNRQDDSETVDIFPVSEAPSILLVESQKEYLAARTAYFLAEFMSTGIAETQDGPFREVVTIQDAIGAGFDVTEAICRVQSSPYLTSTLDYPYPNQHQR